MSQPQLSQQDGSVRRSGLRQSPHACELWMLVWCLRKLLQKLVCGRVEARLQRLSSIRELVFSRYMFVQSFLFNELKKK